MHFSRRGTFAKSLEDAVFSSLVQETLLLEPIELSPVKIWELTEFVERLLFSSSERTANDVNSHVRRELSTWDTRGVCMCVQARSWDDVHILLGLPAAYILGAMLRESLGDRTTDATKRANAFRDLLRYTCMCVVGVRIDIYRVIHFNLNRQIL